MSIVAESFQTYLRRRRRLLARRLKRQQGWVVVLALLALYLLSWDALGEDGSLSHLWRGQPLWLVLIPLLGGGLYSLGAGLLWMLGQRRLPQGSAGSAQLLAQMISLPHLALAALIWLGLAVWGEHLSPFLLRQKNQLLAGLLISWLLAQGWSFFPDRLGSRGWATVGRLSAGAARFCITALLPAPGNLSSFAPSLPRHLARPATGRTGGPAPDSTVV